MPETVLYSIIGLLIAVIGALLKWGYASMVKAIQEVSAKVDLFLASQAACQTLNARTYATKDDISKLWERVDDHTEDIATLKASRR